MDALREFERAVFGTPQYKKIHVEFLDPEGCTELTVMRDTNGKGLRVEWAPF